MAEKRDAPKTPATPAMCNGFIKMLCSAWKTSMKLKVPGKMDHWMKIVGNLEAIGFRFKVRNNENDGQSKTVK